MNFTTHTYQNPTPNNNNNNTITNNNSARLFEQIQNLTDENKLLQLRIKTLEEENQSLKASLFAISCGNPTSSMNNLVGVNSSTNLTIISNPSTPQHYSQKLASGNNNNIHHVRSDSTSMMSISAETNGSGGDTNPTNNNNNNKHPRRGSGFIISSSSSSVVDDSIPLPSNKQQLPTTTTNNSNNNGAITINNNIHNNNNGPWQPWIVLHGHSSAIYSVKWSPCGNFLASCALDGQIRAWKPNFMSDDTNNTTTTTTSTTGEKLSVILGNHSRTGTDLVFIPNGDSGNDGQSTSSSSSRIASSSLDKTIKIFDITKNVQLGSSIFVDSFAMCITSLDSNTIVGGLNNGTSVGIDLRMSSTNGQQHTTAFTFKSNTTTATTTTGRGGGGASIHSLSSFTGEEFHFVTGDAGGFVKIWDRRKLLNHQELSIPIQTLDVCGSSCIDTNLRQISSVGIQDKTLVCATYDNILRIYHIEEEGLKMISSFKGSNIRFSHSPIKIGLLSSSSGSHHSMYDRIYLACGNAGIGGAHLFSIHHPTTTTTTTTHNNNNSNNATTKIKPIQSLGVHSGDGAVYETSFASCENNQDTYNSLATCSADGTIRIFKKM
jgi:WD40 repeat protein